MSPIEVLPALPTLVPSGRPGSRGLPALTRQVMLRRSVVGLGAQVVEVIEGASLGRMANLAGANLCDVERAHLVAYLDGVEVERDRWPEVLPRAEQCVLFAVRPSGDSGKKVLRTILQIAIIAVAAWIGGPANAAFFGSQLAATAAAVTFAAVANLTLTALLPPASANFAGAESGPSIYFLDGAQNDERPFGQVPLLLGRHRMFPPLGGHVLPEHVGDTMFQNVPLVWSSGGLELEPLKLGDTDLIEFKAVQQEHRLHEDDAPHTLYVNDPHIENVGAKLSDSEWEVRETQADTDKIVVVVQFPRGLGAYQDDGRKVSRSVTVRVEWSEDDGVTWETALATTTQAVTGARTASGDPRFWLPSWYNGYAHVGLWRDNLPGGTNTGGAATFTRAEPGTPFRREIEFSVPRGQFKVRVQRTTAESSDDKVVDEVWWVGLLSIADRDPFPVKRIKTSVLRMQSTDELNGVVNRANAVGACVAPTLDGAGEASPATALAANWSTAAPTRNNADMAVVVMRGDFSPSPVSDDAIDWPAWAEFWVWCKLHEFSYDFYHERAISREEELARICAAGRDRKSVV